MFNSKVKNFSLYLFIIVNVILLGALTWLVFQVYGLSTQNILLKSQIEELEIKKTKLSTNQLEFSRLADSLQVLNDYFVSPDQKVFLLDNLEKLADRAEVSYTLNNVLDKEQFSLDVSISGSFKNIYYFIRLVETSGYWVSFKKLSLSRRADGSAGNWSSSLIISIPLNLTLL